MPTKDAQHALWRHRGVFDEHMEYNLHGNTEIGLVTISDGLLKLNGTVVDIHSAALQIVDAHTISIKTVIKEVVLLTPTDKSQFHRLLAALVLWSFTKPIGATNKLLMVPFERHRDLSNESDTLLISRCSVVSHLPKLKNLEFAQLDTNVIADGVEFNAMIVLKSNGTLHFINESDGQEIYAVDIIKLRSEEIFGLHRSLFDSSCCLFLGLIPHLRRQHFPNEPETSPTISTFPRVEQLVLKFEYRTDAEDWLIALKSFSIKQRVGLDEPSSLRLSKQVTLCILETKMMNSHPYYAEVQTNGIPLFRTAIVEGLTPFFREIITLDLPIQNQAITVLLKISDCAKSKSTYSFSDTICGSSIIDCTKNIHSNTQILKNGQSVGDLFYSVSSQEFYIPPHRQLQRLKSMVGSVSLFDLQSYIRGQPDIDLEYVSRVLLDTFFALGRENEWINALIEKEVADSMTKGKKELNSLFRGNSLLTKTLELFLVDKSREYLDIVFAGFIKNIVEDTPSVEMDPMRSPDTGEQGEQKDDITQNFKNLQRTFTDLWNLVRNTSSCLPESIKAQLAHLRRAVVMYSTSNDLSYTIELNAVVAFLFLRLLCPVLLNPKLFDLTTTHTSGDAKRCLTLLSKLLLKLANGTFFDAKEPYLLPFNDFLEDHREEMLEYLDKVTLKKLDFGNDTSEKYSTLLETPAPMFVKSKLWDGEVILPRLIDVALRLVQTMNILVPQPEKSSGALSDITSLRSSEGVGGIRRSPAIGSLEFEKLRLVDSSSDMLEFGSDEFMRTLLKTDSTERVPLPDTSLADLLNECKKIKGNVESLKNLLEPPEGFEDVAVIFDDTQTIFGSFVIDVDRRIWKPVPNVPNANMLKMDTDDAFNALKVKFEGDAVDTINNLSSPTKRLSKMIRSASINTLSSFTAALDDRSKSPTKRKNWWFKR